MNKHNDMKGFTLIELLVYIALLSVIVVIAGNAYMVSVRFSYTTTGKMNTTVGINEVMGYLEDDMSLLGAKAQQNAAMATISHLVYMDTAGGDFSSYAIGANGVKDTLTFRSSIYGSTGAITDVQEVKWFVDASNYLWRSQRLLSTNALTTIKMGSNVTRFHFDAGLLTADSSATVKTYAMADSLRLCLKSGTGAVTMANSGGIKFSGFTADLLSEAFLCDGGGIAKTLTFQPGLTYSVQFNLAPDSSMSANFQPNVDMVGVGFRTISGSSLIPITDVEDYMVWAGKVNGAMPRFFKFTQGTGMSINAAMLFRLKVRAAAIGGSLTIDSLKIWSSSLAGYDWRPANGAAPSLAQKVRVKGIRADVELTINGGSSHLVRIISIPNNGV